MGLLAGIKQAGMTLETSVIQHLIEPQHQPQTAADTGQEQTWAWEPLHTKQAHLILFLFTPRLSSPTSLGTA